MSAILDYEADRSQFQVSLQIVENDLIQIGKRWRNNSPISHEIQPRMKPHETRANIQTRTNLSIEKCMHGYVIVRDNKFSRFTNRQLR